VGLQLPAQLQCAVRSTEWGAYTRAGVWAEDCSFYFYPMYRDDHLAVDRHDGWGQRPSVIIRGNTPGHFGINTVPTPSHNCPNRKYGLTEIYLHFEIPIRILM
jgi:hypothetical protein